MPDKFNHLCPVCQGPIHIVRFGVACDIAIKPAGWAIIVTPKISNGSECFSCPRCQITVPCDWVYGELPEKDAKKLMQKWGVDPHSIHNLAPMGESKKERKAKDPEGEPKPEPAEEKNADQADRAQG